MAHKFMKNAKQMEEETNLDQFFVVDSIGHHLSRYLITLLY